MPTEKKIQTVDELTRLLARSTVVIGTDYRGLRVADTTALRRLLRENDIELQVVKNTLFWRAAEASGKPGLAQLAEGPTALVIGFGDPIAPVKAVVEYQRGARNTFAARRAYLDGQVFGSERLPELAALPSKEVLIAEVAGALQSPLLSFAYLIQATLHEFAGLLEARAGQLEGAAA